MKKPPGTGGVWLDCGPIPPMPLVVPEPCALVLLCPLYKHTWRSSWGTVTFTSHYLAGIENQWPVTVHRCGEAVLVPHIVPKGNEMSPCPQRPRLFPSPRLRLSSSLWSLASHDTHSGRSPSQQLPPSIPFGALEAGGQCLGRGRPEVALRFPDPPPQLQR